MNQFIVPRLSFRVVLMKGLDDGRMLYDGLDYVRYDGCVSYGPSNDVVGP